MAWVPFTSVFPPANLEFLVAPTSVSGSTAVYTDVEFEQFGEYVFWSAHMPPGTLFRVVLTGASASRSIPWTYLWTEGEVYLTPFSEGVVDFDIEASPNYDTLGEFSNITMSADDDQGFTFSGEFQFFVWSDEPEPPGGQCFWTDLVNATQVCGAAPEPPSGVAAFWGTDREGDGSGMGRLAVIRNDTIGPEPDYRAPMMCSDPLFDALSNELDFLLITGYAVAEGLNTTDGEWPGVGDIGLVPVGYDSCSVPLDPDAVSWAAAEFQMWPDSFGERVEYRWFNDGTLDSYTWYYVRIKVDGNGPDYYGVIYLGGGI